MPLSQTERVGRELLKHYLPFLKVWYGIRPSWLSWPVTGNRLELDIYFPEIKVAVEIDGIQHGRFIAGMQRTFDVFERQQARDLWKVEECARLGITVYKLTIFDLTEQRFPAKLRQIIESGKVHAKGDWALYDRLVYAQERVSYVTPPRDLFATAERLSRARFKPYRPKRVSWWRKVLRLLTG